MGAALAGKLTSTFTKTLSKTSKILRRCKTSIGAHVAKSLVDANDTASSKLDSEKIMSAVLASIDPKINGIAKISFNLQSPTFLQSTNSKASQGLQIGNQDLTKPIETVNNIIVTASTTKSALETI